MSDAAGAQAATPPRDGILARTAMGAGWMFAWRMVTRLLGLASTLVLVRILAPEDFGLVALAFAVAATLETMLTIGVEQQIVRARETSRELYDTAFTLNAVRGVLLAVLVALLAEPMAGFFAEPRLGPVVLALSLVPLLAGLVNVGATEYTRRLEFGVVFKLMLVPRLLQVAVTVSAALVFQSHWALVAGALTGRLAGTVMTYIYHPYRPRLSLALWRELLGISLWTWLLGLAVALRDRTEVFLIGWLLGPRFVGLHTISVEIAALPVTELASPISQAAMPGFAATLRSPGEQDAARSALQRILGLTMLVALPLGLGLSLVAGPVVALALGQSWVEAAPLIAVLAAGCVGVPLTLVCQALLNAQAKLRLLVGLTLAGAGLRAVCVLALAPYLGLLGAVIGVSVAVILEMALNMAVTSRRLRLGWDAILQAWWRPLAGGLVMVAVLSLAGFAWPGVPPDAWAAARSLLPAVALGALAYLGTVAALWWLAGAPQGAETDVFELARRVGLRAGERLARRRPALG